VCVVVVEVEDAADDTEDVDSLERKPVLQFLDLCVSINGGLD
jgi:hypothetical protein